MSAIMSNPEYSGMNKSASWQLMPWFCSQIVSSNDIEQAGSMGPSFARVMFSTAYGISFLEVSIYVSKINLARTVVKPLSSSWSKNAEVSYMSWCCHRCLPYYQSWKMSCLHTQTRPNLRALRLCLTKIGQEIWFKEEQYAILATMPIALKSWKLGSRDKNTAVTQHQFGFPSPIAFHGHTMINLSLYKLRVHSLDYAKNTKLTSW